MTYIGITIGPVWETIENTKRLDALWAGSYIFSYLMKTIIAELKNIDINDKQFIVPFTEYTYEMGDAGLYPDRIIFEANDNFAMDSLQTIFINILNEFAKDVYRHFNDCLDKKIKAKLKINSISEQAVINFTQDYFKIYAVKADLPKGENIIRTVNRYLDSIELLNTNVRMVDDSKHYIRIFLENVKGSFLLNKKRLCSIPEVAGCRYFENETNINDKTEDRITQTENYLGTEAAFHHESYIALVMADGDNMGKYISGLETTEECRKFSETIFNFGQKAVEKIKNFGGEPVYVGGDDLVFVAPLKSKDSHSTIFDLVNELTKKGKDDLPVTLSFGISINYYKFPLYEALEAARKQLQEYAKKKRNTISIRYLTHSGKSFMIDFYKGLEISLFNQFLTLLNNIEWREDYLNSVRQKILINKILLDNAAGNQTLLDNFFENTFNESIHDEKQNREFLNAVKEYIFRIYDEKEGNEIEKINTILRFVHFFFQKGKICDTL